MYCRRSCWSWLNRSFLGSFQKRDVAVFDKYFLANVLAREQRQLLNDLWHLHVHGLWKHAGHKCITNVNFDELEASSSSLREDEA